MACEQVFVRQLRQRGFRLTPPREIILSVLHDVEGMATAEEIYSRVQDTGRKSCLNQFLPEFLVLYHDKSPALQVMARWRPVSSVYDGLYHIL